MLLEAGWRTHGTQSTVQIRKVGSPCKKDLRPRLIGQVTEPVYVSEVVEKAMVR